MPAAGLKDKIRAIVFLVLSLVYSFGCLHLKVGALDNPGAGLIPRIIGLLLLLFTGIHCFKVFRHGSKGADSSPKEERPNYAASLGIAASVVAYPFLLLQFKFLLATFAVVLVMLLLLRYRKWWASVVISAAVTVCSLLIFSRLLGVVLPSGWLEQMVFGLI